MADAVEAAEADTVADAVVVKDLADVVAIMSMVLTFLILTTVSAQMSGTDLDVKAANVFSVRETELPVVAD